MPFKSSESSDAAVAEVATSTSAAAKEHGTVLMAFNGPTRRFAVDSVVTDSDVADLPMSLDDLKSRGLIA